MLTLPQLLRVPQVDNGLRFALSPDEKSIVFSWNKTGTWELWRAESPGVALERLETFEVVQALPGAKFSPCFSPDGTKIAFALDLDGSESYHIAIYDFITNTTTDLTPQILYANQPNMSWSPDGRSLAVLSDANGQFALYALPLDGSRQRMIRNIFHPCWDAAWSPDGRWIAVESEALASDRSIHIVPVGKSSKGAKTVQLMQGGKPLNAQHPSWSPDSKLLAFSCENNEWFNIGLYDVETKEITWMTDSVGDDAQPTWSRSGDVLGWVHSHGAGTSFQFKQGSDPIREARVGEGVHAHPQITGSGEAILIYEDANHPPDLWKINLESGEAKQLTKSLDVALSFSQPEEMSYPGMDGAPIPALFYHTEPSEKAVLYIHGGPNWNLQNAWNPVLSFMAARGWTVLAPNYRGSTGYGKKWQNASRYNMGGVDNDDCAAGAKYLLENGFANRVAVTGRSHGGYLTMTCLTGFPELFAGGSAVVPFLNWIKSHKNSREDLQHWNIENMGDPEENHALWVQRSPYFFLERVNAPVQMICGENDPRCPASESVDAKNRLLELGKEVELCLYKGEGHSFLKIENVIDAEMKRMVFLEKVLQQ